MFSICLCAWNDLEFLKILHAGIKRNTRIPYELIVHDNGSEDGTWEWLEENKITRSRSEENLGVAAVNYAVKLAQFPYIIDINADMYPLPMWDLDIFKQINEFKRQGIEKYTISSCLVEPVGSNPEYTIHNCGTSPETFEEEKLRQDYFNNYAAWDKPNTTQYSHPIGMPKALWDEFGGVDMSYQFGVGTDHDISACAYESGCRDFIMLGKSRVYHFICQTIGKLSTNRPDGQAKFKEKWGISVAEFRERMGIAKPYRRVPDGIL